MYQWVFDIECCYDVIVSVCGIGCVCNEYANEGVDYD